MELLLEHISPFLVRSDLLTCCSINQSSFVEYHYDRQALREHLVLVGLLTGVLRSAASGKIARWWRLRRLECWMNNVARSVARMHAFPHRTSTNYIPWKRHFTGGLAGIDRILSKTRFTPRLSKPIECSKCNKNSVDSATYLQIGSKMARSTPTVSLTCSLCADGVTDDDWDFNGVYLSSLCRWKAGDVQWTAQS